MLQQKAIIAQNNDLKIGHANDKGKEKASDDEGFADETKDENVGKGNTGD